MKKRRPYHRKNNPPMFDCEQCGKNGPRSFELGRRRFNYDQRFCSHACANSARPKKIWLDKHGYPQMRTPDGRNTAVHRYVMEKKIGRRLLPSETVHHKDGNRKNYDESNLELWTGRHGRGQRTSDVFHLSANEFVLGALAMGG